ncbi:DUF4017 family protein [Sutcliffiella halmapala]|uniref:DUF4017 family protein n=1 Tax=Sutcliffiella halmapala TaxID=79882 RepID=UPI000995BE4D|nr:DUF4017 family protein [Sutcliffiella halmapala]
MKNLVLPLLAYVLVCVLVVIAPASTGYDTLGWKLFAGQMYAIPAFVVVALFSFYVNKKPTDD